MIQVKNIIPNLTEDFIHKSFVKWFNLQFVLSFNDKSFLKLFEVLLKYLD